MLSWDTFWLPNLLQATVFAAIGAVVAAIVGLVVRRWIRILSEQLFGEQQQTKELAKTAATNSVSAVEEAKKAAKHAGAANENADGARANSEKANEAIVYLAEQLGRESRRSEYLAEQTNRLVGALAHERAGQPDMTDLPSPSLLVPSDGGGVDEPLTVTGRHRLHTSLIDTAPYSDFDSQEQPW